MIDTEILEDYSSEARELLDEMDHNLMRLENEGSSPELLNNVFRAVHCIKGSAEYIGLERSSTLTHGVENLLDRLREGAAELTPPIVEFLFRAKDLIATLIAEVSQHHVESSEISGIMEELDALLGGAQIERPEAQPTITQEFPDESLPPEAPPDRLEPVLADHEGTWDEGTALDAHFVDSDEGETHEIQEPIFDELPDRHEAEPGGEALGQETEEAEEVREIMPDSAEEFAMGQAPVETLGSEGSLEETVPHILSIYLYLDDLQDGLNEEEALSSILQKLELLKEHPGFGSYPEMLNILKSIEDHLSTVSQGFAGMSPEDIDRLRSLLHALRPYYPESLFPLEPRGAAPADAQAPESEAEHAIRSSLIEELEQVPGVTPSVAEAIFDAGFSSWDEVAAASMSSLTSVEGVSPSLARNILIAAGVTPPEPKPVPVAPTESRSLLADVDDELLSEFEGIFGRLSEPEHPGEQQAQTIPFDRAADLLEELDGVGAETDREIMEIFLSYGWEILHKLRPIVGKIGEEGADRSHLERAADLIRQIRSSSTYMDYQKLASFLDDWYEKTLWVCERLDSVSLRELSFMQNSLLRFQDFLAGLEAALNPESEALREGDSTTSPQPSGSPEQFGYVSGGSVSVGRDRRETAVSDASTAVSDDAGDRRVAPGPVRPASPATVGSQEQTTITQELPVVAGPSVPDLTREGALVKTMRVDSGKVDVLLNQVGELVVNRSYVEQLSTELKDFQRLLMSAEFVGKREIAIVKDLTLKVAEASLSLGRVATDIQEGVMKLRMLPVGQLFNRMPRLIRDLSRRVGKVVNLEVYGGDTEVDKRVIEQIYNPLVHLIRNAVDHGIEEGEVRKGLGKTEEGTVTLRAYSEGNQVVIDVEDDGTGINRAAVISRAVESRFIDAQDAENIPMQEVYNFLFMPGFSTSEQVTRTSGRGVGMDVVKKDVEKINGHIEIESWEEQGTRISIKIPLTLAIIQTLLIKSGTNHFAVPLTSVREIIQVSDDDIETIEGFEVIKFRDETIPVLRIAELFHLDGEEKSKKAKFLVIATAGLKTVGFLVEELVGEQDVVIKPLAEHVCEIRGLAGSTILGDGTIALVMDVTEIVDDIIFQQRQAGGQGTPFGQSDPMAELR